MYGCDYCAVLGSLLGVGIIGGIICGVVVVAGSGGGGCCLG